MGTRRGWGARLRPGPSSLFSGGALWENTRRGLVPGGDLGPGRTGRTVRSWLVTALIAVLAASAPAAAVEKQKPVPPSTVVREYLSAVQGGDFAKAYDLVTERLRDGLNRDNWAGRLEGQVADRGRTKILFMRVHPPILKGDEATVVASFRLETPNGRKVAKETYNLLRENGRWRIDTIKVYEAPEQ